MRLSRRAQRGIAAFLYCAFFSFSATSEEVVVSHYGTQLNTAAIAVALERGDFKKHGIDITGVLTAAGGGTSMRNLLAGELPYGEMGTSGVLAAHKQGVNIRIVNAASRTLEDLLWVTMPNSPVKSIKDLAGRKIAITSAKSITQLLSQMAFDAEGIAPGKYQQIALGSVAAGLTALEQGNVDAAPILEPLWSSRAGRYRVAFDLSKLPSMTQTVGVTTVEYATKHPDKLRAIIAARRDAVDFIYANPEEAAKMMSKQFGSNTLPVDVAIRAVKNMVAIRYWSPGNIEMSGLEAMVDGMKRLGQWEGPVEWDKIVDRSYLPSDLQK